MGVRIPPDPNRRPFGDPQIALPERDVVALGEADELLRRELLPLWLQCFCHAEIR